MDTSAGTGIPVNTACCATEASTINTTPEAAALHSCTLDIESLARADGLHEVIMQLRSGEVQRIRDKYGPTDTMKAKPQWEHIKNTMSKRERLHKILRDDFGDDEAKFLKFFQVPDSERLQQKSRKSKTKHAGPPTETPSTGNNKTYRPFRLVKLWKRSCVGTQTSWSRRHGPSTETTAVGSSWQHIGMPDGSHRTTGRFGER